MKKIEHPVDTVDVLQENINVETNVANVGANKEDVENISSLDMLQANYGSDAERKDGDGITTNSTSLNI